MTATGAIAKGALRSANPIGGTVLLYAALACFVALAIGMFSGWWVGDELEEGKTAKNELITARADNKANNAYIERQQQVIADSSRRLEEAAVRMSAISEEAANARAENQRQFTLLRGQLETALAARPDLADVRVGNGVLEAWNSANRGRATGSAGATQPAAGVRSQPAATGTRKPARSKER